MRGCSREAARSTSSVRSLRWKLRIGVEHDRNIDGVGDGAEIGFDLRVLEREVGFEDGEDAVGAEPLVGLAPASTASAVAVEATPAITGTRLPAASMVALHDGVALRAR